MKLRFNCKDKAASCMVGVALILIGFFLMVLGLTFLPVVGLLAAIPLMGLSLYFLNPRVELIITEEKAEATSAADEGSWCPWPRIFQSGHMS